MSLTKTSYSMINGAPKNAVDYGAALSKTAAENTAAIQLAIDVNTDGGLIVIPKGCAFNLKQLDGSVNEYNLQYWSEDEADAVGDGSVAGTNETIYWSSNWKNSGGGTTDVNEWRFQAPYHPGIILNNRENIEHYGSGPDNRGQASLVYKKDNYNQFQVQQLYNADRNIFTIGSWEVRLAFPIGSSSFSVAPAAQEIIVGDTSGARGIILAVTASTMTVSWLYGTFQSGETVTVAGTNTSTVPLPSAPTFSYVNKPFRFSINNNLGGVCINAPAERAISPTLLIGGRVVLETGFGGGFGTAAARLDIVNDVLTPTTGGAFSINAGGDIQLTDASGALVGSFNPGETFTVTVKDAVSGNSVTPSQNCFYRESAGLVFFTIRLINIVTTGLTAGNQIHIVGLPITSNSTPLTTVATVSFSSITTTAGNVVADIPNNSNYMILWDQTTTGRAALNVSAISSGSGDLFISGCYAR
jgi:hypothetical protein